MPNELKLVISVLGVVLVALNIIIPMIVAVNGETGFFKVLPQDLHKSTKMNWFGCVLTSIVILVFLPLIWIGRLIFWLCHVGRKEKSQWEE